MIEESPRSGIGSRARTSTSDSEGLSNEPQEPSKTTTGRGDKKDPDRFNDWSDEAVTVVRPKKISE